LCALENALHGGACADQSVPETIQHDVTKAADAIDRADTSPPKKAKHLRKRASLLLKRAAQLATNAGKGRRAKLSPQCTASLRSAIDGERRTAE